MTFKIDIFKKIQYFIDKNSSKRVNIIAISKNHPISSVETAIALGIRVFGENRVQEADKKFIISGLKNKFTDLRLHLTGPLQTNKVKKAIDIFDVFHTLDRESLAKEFSKYSEKIYKKTLFIQINTGKEIGKSGVVPEMANEFIKYCKNDLNLIIHGLMCIPPIDESPSPHFTLLKNLASKNNIKHLSMGMSGDYEDAILSGSTHVRVGTLLFGERKYEN